MHISPPLFPWIFQDGESYPSRPMMAMADTTIQIDTLRWNQFYLFPAMWPPLSQPTKTTLDDTQHLFVKQSDDPHLHFPGQHSEQRDNMYLSPTMSRYCCH